jgi:two-component system sensor histidine kinase YesM
MVINMDTENTVKTEKKSKRHPISLRRRLLLLVVILWSVPVLFIFLFVTISYRNSIIEKTEMLMEEWAKNFTSINSQRIDEAITISKKTSYELIIEKAWKKYKAGDITGTDFYQEIYSNLKSKFYNDNRFVISVFYLSDNPDRLYYTSRQPMDYINTYYDSVEAEARKITEQDTSDAHVIIINNKIYIIRNLYTTTNYTKFGTLVLELNKDRLFGGIQQNKDYEMGIYINNSDSVIYCNDDLSEDSKAGILNKMKQSYSRKLNRKLIKAEDGVYTGLLYQQKFDDYHFGTILIANRDVIYSELKDIRNIILLMSVIIIPVFIYMLYFIARHITKPIGRIIGASKELEKGNIGMQVEGDPMPNAEFTYLLNSFNRMSSEIKYIIDYAYNEELAKKEAKIIALQSQINPHFLNNTLEMMNWQARMAGDVEVTKMIEALGTLLDYTMDRSNKKLINLSEELRCADAYLFITSMRFGQRLRVEKEIDNSLLSTKVPQLILQPIIENAVVHGVEVVKSGVIRLKVYKEGDNILLQVINTGKSMTPEDMERIKNILENKNTELTPGKGVHASLGIRNVNERIKLIYGEEYGLTIEPAGEDETASTITIPSEPVNDTEKQKILNNLLKQSL